MPPKPRTQRLARGEELFIDCAVGFSIVKPAGWREADRDELRQSMDTRQWRRPELMPPEILAECEPPALALISGPRSEKLVGYTVSVARTHEPDPADTPQAYLSNLLPVYREIIFFDLLLRRRPTAKTFQGWPAADMVVTATAFPLEGPPALCVLHDLVLRRGPDLVRLSSCHPLDGGTLRTPRGFFRARKSFRVFEPTVRRAA